MLLTEPLPILTSNLEGSFAGVSKTGFKKPWNLTLSRPELETVAGYPILTLQWCRETSDGDLHHVCSYKFATPADASTHAPVYKRVFAHFVLDELPDTAIADVLDYLGNAWVFNRPLDHEVVSPTKPLRGKVARRYERPTYSIEE